MKTVNVSGLKNNPSEALRQARDEPVLVMNRNTPDAPWPANTGSLSPAPLR